MMKTKKIVLLSSLTMLFLPATTSLAQAQSANALEEIVVTGRKREESLNDVPVSISVFNESLLFESGIESEENLFAATVGLDLASAGGTRTDNMTGVRGVQSELRASNQQKVSSFIDGLPLIGNTGTLGFDGIDAVEVYRGPQSAAFGRSTFAGAINYVTSDASEEFEAKVSVKQTDLNSQEVGILLSGPLTDRIGYRVSYLNGDNEGPDEWRSTDGIDLGSQETERLSAKLNFAFSDTVYGEIAFTRTDTFDQGGAGYQVDLASCGPGSGIIRGARSASVELPAGDWDCDVSQPPEGGIPKNHDVLGQFVAQYDVAAYTAQQFINESEIMTIGTGMMATQVLTPPAVLSTDANADGSLSLEEFLAVTNAQGATYEQLLISQSVPNPGEDAERDRIQGELNFEFGDSLLQFLGMYSTEDYFGWADGDSGNSVAEFTSGDIGANTMSMASLGDIEESYLEVRWVSPEDQRLRYLISGSYYDYEQNDFAFAAYNALEQNLIVEAGPNAGDPVDPGQGTQSGEITTNAGIGFGLNYDLTDRTTLSLEGRYQVDEICSEDLATDVSLCAETTSFQPRIGINTTISDNLSVYGQFSIGNNPAGVNGALVQQGAIDAIRIANGTDAVPVGEVNAGEIYNGVGGNPDPVVTYNAEDFQTYDEEELTNIEFGLKGSFAGGQGSYTAAVYYAEFDGIVVNQALDWDDDGVGGWNEGNWNQFTLARTNLNQGDAELSGIELTASYAVNETWQVGGYVALAEAEFKDFCSIEATEYFVGSLQGDNLLDILTPEDDGVLADCGRIDGNQLVQHSPVTANVNISAFLPEFAGFSTTLRLDVQHQGKYFEDQLNLLERSAVTKANISATMRSDNWTIRAFVNNLADNDDPLGINTTRNFNDAGLAQAPTSNDTFSIVAARPREIGLQLEYNF